MNERDSLGWVLETHYLLYKCDHAPSTPLEVPKALEQAEKEEHLICVSISKVRSRAVSRLCRAGARSQHPSGHAQYRQRQP